MKKLPRLARIGINTVLIAVFFFLYYVFVGSPAFTAEQAFRRAEQRNLVGPGEILGIVVVPDKTHGYDRLLVAETEEGVLAYCYRDANLGFIKGNTFSSMEGNLYYREKREHVTVIAAPTNFMIADYEKLVQIPFVIFDDYPAAVRAELDVCLTDDLTDGFGEYRYALQGVREHDGYFTLLLTAGDGSEGLGYEGYALGELCKMHADGAGASEYYYASVRLYDEEDVLLYEEDLVQRSVGGEARAKRENTP